MLGKIINYFLKNRIVSILILILVFVWGISSSPFNWHGNLIPTDPVPVDAIPDIGENQQIVATEWMGRSPKDIQDQITYPLSTSLLGIPGVKTIRSSSMFGMSFIYIIFDDNIEFYWSRSRILEKLNSLPPGTLPKDVQPTLGPDATALGQIFWYTLEGRNPDTGEPTGGWSQEELRTVQDYYLRYALASANGVSEVASVGGFVKEYQVDINPKAMYAFGVSIMDIMKAIQQSNLDIGAETMEINRAEYLIRGIGYIKSIADLENTVISSKNNIPIRISEVANVSFGPATRRGGLDKEGLEAVGGVVVARYASNPMEVINNVKAKIEEAKLGLPQKTLSDGSISKLTIIPFYDRTSLIKETIGTLETALSHEVLICIIVIIVLVLNLRASIIIASLLPIAVLACFILMRYTGVSANIVALSGIAIAIGVMVDIGIVFVESIIRHKELPENKDINGGQALVALISKAVLEVSGAITTAVVTTVVSFLPVFTMQAQEGKLFSPLAYTKTFALASTFILGLILLPTISYYIFSLKIKSKHIRTALNLSLIPLGIVLLLIYASIPALALTAIGINNLISSKLNTKYGNAINIAITLFAAIYYLAQVWLPLGPQKGLISNILFVGICIGIILALLWMLVIYYEQILRWCLSYRKLFLLLPILTIVFGINVWLGFNRSFGFLAEGFELLGWKTIRESRIWESCSNRFPGIGEEFMPTLNEGSFLLMPTSMPHTGVEQNREYIATIDRRVTAIPEVESCIGKWGRVNSALDPAPIQMFENTINYRPEYILDVNGKRQSFKTNGKGAFLMKNGGTYNPKDGFKLIPVDSLIPSRRGVYFRQWRSHIKSANDIWNEIVAVSHLPGITSAPKLQPIEARLVMLSTGLRAAMGVKVYGADLDSIEKGGKAIEHALKHVPSIISASVFYDRAVGAPYIEIKLNRMNLARYGISVSAVQETLEAGIGGMELTKTVEGRERFSVRLRYAREYRTSPEDLAALLVSSPSGTQIPLNELASIEYAKGAQMIQSENTFLLGYVIFDKEPGKAEGDVVKEAQKQLELMMKKGDLLLPYGVSFKFAGNYEQQERATKRLMLVIPLALVIVLLVLYFQFKTLTASLIHFSGVFMAFAGAFILIWLYGEDWFLNFSVAGENMRNLFQIAPVNLSVAVWVGFIALFGIATDDGVLMGTYIHKVFTEQNPQTKAEIREAVVEAGLKRIRPAAMTTATTLIALLPILSSTGKGAEIMIPMAIPTFGGMLIQSMTMFVVPVLQCQWRERVLRKQKKENISQKNQ